MENVNRKMLDSLQRGFINREHPVTTNFRPQLLLNDENNQVLPTILQELKHCTEFFISVAFITESGLAMLKTALWELAEKGIQGKIITSTYLNFNKPKVFQELLKLKNVDVRLSNLEGFHAKGYYFKNEDHSTFIVGSSNLTANALKMNYEWNVKLSSLENGELVTNFVEQFERVWEHSIQLSEEWIKNYESNYQAPDFSDKVMEVPSKFMTNSLSETIQIQPNSMQEVALKQIADLRNKGEKRGLVISATGTGKTYLSAFEVRAFRPKKMLFIVHREQILKKAMSDYKKIVGGTDEEFGIFSGSRKEVQAKYLFATIQSISKDEILNAFDPEEFEYIIIDEVHKAGAKSYIKTIDYFKPKFLLGMTATPERTDDINIYEIFDYNVAYEIRLQAALEEDMLCPFHYFGLTDLVIENELIDDKSTFNNLVSENRVEHVLERAEYYGFSGDSLKGLVFCASKKEANELALLFANRGYKTASLTGEDTQEKREETISQLEIGKLEYIFTVDIFNEGIDIPSVNQIIMLRQTKSSIIFIQQLGRGLRKHASKEYVTIIDFIGNYANNYLIPIALSGDQSFNKEQIRKKTMDMDLIKGVSSINFEEVAKQQIFESINNSKIDGKRSVKFEVTKLAERLGRQPKLIDFMLNDSIDPEVVIGCMKPSTYHNVLKYLKMDTGEISTDQDLTLYFFGKELMNGKRAHELILMKALILNGEISKVDFLNQLKDFGTRNDTETINSMERVLNLDFYQAQSKKIYNYPDLIEVTADSYQLKLDVSNEYFKDSLLDIIEVGLLKTTQYDQYEMLTMNKKYSRLDFCRLKNLDKDLTNVLMGYKILDQYCPLFVTYRKDDKLATDVHYGDEFLSPDVLKWISRTPRTMESEEIMKIMNHKELGLKLPLFVKNSSAEGTDSYYLGEVEYMTGSAQNEKVKSQKDEMVSAVSMNYKLEVPVEYSIYQFLTN
ncbi:DUF3427 domain-containing protein [Kurthia gibsonii]|uniref:DUF3427 domain-containing protein n=1 Tax=Kurthia gibsonii TaxID=33946 RepID=UPI0034CD1CA4